MKLVVIGASNSIIGEKGYIGALRKTHEVVNLSAGDVPIFFTLSKILTKQEDIAQADYIILDHSISDRLSYFPKLREDYTCEIQDIYRILTSINPNVISVIFPLKLISKPHEKYLQEMEAICRRQSVYFVNFQPIATDINFFEDVAHVHCEVSYLMGLCLGQFISGLRLRHRTKPAMADHGYVVREARSVSPNQKVLRFKSSLAEAEYVVINSNTTLKFEQQHQAVYIEYVVLRDDPRWMALEINGGANYYGGLNITGDLISGSAAKTFLLSSIKDERELQLNFSRGPAISTRYCPMNLVRMILRKEDWKLEHTHLPAFERHDFDITTLAHNLERLKHYGWFEQMQDLSDQAAGIIHQFNQKGMVNHKRYFSDTVEKGNSVRKKRMEVFWNSNPLDLSDSLGINPAL